MAPPTKPGAPSKRERLRLISDLMTGNRWVTGQTGPALARQWGLSVVTLEKDAAEASRSVRRAVEGDTEIRARILAGVQHCIAQATIKGQLRTAIEGLRLMADLTAPNGEEDKPTELHVTWKLADSGAGAGVDKAADGGGQVPVPGPEQKPAS